MTVDHGRATRMLQALLAACDPSGLLDDGADEQHAYDAILEEAGHHLVAAGSTAQLTQWLTLLLHEELGSTPDAERMQRMSEAAMGWRATQVDDPRLAATA